VAPGCDFIDSQFCREHHWAGGSHRSWVTVVTDVLDDTFLFFIRRNTKTRVHTDIST
jgi:hypothetical protein